MFYPEPESERNEMEKNCVGESGLMSVSGWVKRQATSGDDDDDDDDGILPKNVNEQSYLRVETKQKHTGNIWSVAAMFKSLRKHCVIFNAVVSGL